MIKATCHCRAVELCVTLSEPLSNARRCDCSFCAMRGAAVVFADVGNVAISKGQEHLSCYQWNTKQEEHYFCKHCGIYTHHRHANPTAGYAVNLAAIEGAHPKDHDPIPWIDGVNYQPADYTKGRR
ncbi:MAG: GFA family protein [Octadecabacter sp.]